MTVTTGRSRRPALALSALFAATIVALFGGQALTPAPATAMVAEEGAGDEECAADLLWFYFDQCDAEEEDDTGGGSSEDDSDGDYGEDDGVDGLCAEFGYCDDSFGGDGGDGGAPDAISGGDLDQGEDPHSNLLAEDDDVVMAQLLDEEDRVSRLYNECRTLSADAAHAVDIAEAGLYAQTITGEPPSVDLTPDQLFALAGACEDRFWRGAEAIDRQRVRLGLPPRKGRLTFKDEPIWPDVVLERVDDMPAAPSKAAPLASSQTAPVVPRAAAPAAALKEDLTTRAAAPSPATKKKLAKLRGRRAKRHH
jgi:hypothetical protein